MRSIRDRSRAQNESRTISDEIAVIPSNASIPLVEEAGHDVARKPVFKRRLRNFIAASLRTFELHGKMLYVTSKILRKDRKIEGLFMDLASLVNPSRIIIGARAAGKTQLLQDLASRAAAKLNLDAETIYAALRAREDLGSTGLGGGFALPHARVEGLDRFFGLFARTSRPIPYDSIDGKPVDLVFLLLIPAKAGGEHLAALAAISRRLRDRDCAEQLRHAASADALCGILCDPQHS